MLLSLRHALQLKPQQTFSFEGDALISFSNIFKDPDTNSGHNISNPHEEKKHFHTLLSALPS